MFLLLMMKRSMSCHKMKILVMLSNHLKFNSGGPTGRDNLLGGINVILTDDGEPECFREAMESEENEVRFLHFYGKHDELAKRV